MRSRWHHIASEWCRYAVDRNRASKRCPNWGMVSRIREVMPNAKLVYNNSPSFNWTLNFRKQVHEEWVAAGKDVSSYPDPAENPQGLMDPKYDESELAQEADKLCSHSKLMVLEKLAFSTI